MTRTHYRVGVCAALAVGFLGTLLPAWTATAGFVGNLSVNAIEGDGILLIAALALSAAFLLASHHTPWGRWIGLIFSSAATLLAADFIRRYVELSSDTPSGVFMTVGAGIPVMFVGAAGMVAMSIAAFVRFSQRDNEF